MITVSPEFEAAAAADVQFVRAKLDILWTDPSVQSGNTVSATDINNLCGLSSTVTDAMLLQTVDIKDKMPYKFVRNNGAVLNDGTWHPCPGTVEEVAAAQFGWHTAEVSDGSGDFSTPPQLTVTFANARAINQVRVFGQSITGYPLLDEWPTDFDIQIYDVSDTLLNTTTNFSGTSAETIIDFSDDEIIDATYMILTLNSWSEINEIGKITEFFGVISNTVYGDDIISMDILEESQPKGTNTIGNMSCNELRIELQNVDVLDQVGGTLLDPYLPDNTDSYLKNAVKPNVRMTPYLGFKLPDTSIEYVKMGSFWTKDWNVSEWRFAASVTARDRLEILRLNEFTLDTVPINETLYELTERVLNHAKTYIPLNDLTWSIDAQLSTVTVPYGWFGKDITYFEALSQIAGACIGRCYMNRDDVLIVESYLADAVSGSADMTITADDYFSCNRPVNSSKIKNRIVVPASELTLEDEGEITTSDDFSMGSGDTTIAVSVEWGDDAVLEASATPDDETDITVSFSGFTYYPWGVTLTATKTSGTEGTFKVKVVGQKLVLNTISESVAEDSDSIALYKKRELRLPQNFLVQTEGHAQIIADNLLLTTSDPTNECSVETTGNPASEVGDIADIEVYSKLSVEAEFRVQKQQFKYDGGLRCMITGKKTIDIGV